MTPYELLLNSGIPITWTVLYLAWYRNSNVSTPVPKVITTQQLLAFAMDRIGYGPPEQEPFVAELAFADELDTWTIQRCMDALATDAPQEVQFAVRVWRWVTLSNIIAGLDHASQKAPDATAPEYGVWTDDFRTNVYCNLHEFWDQFEFSSQGFAVAESWSQDGGWLKDIPSTLSLLGEYKGWLDYEASDLRRSGQDQDGGASSS